MTAKAIGSFFNGAAGFGAGGPGKVWAGSIAKDVAFRPIKKRDAVRIWWAAQRFNNKTRTQKNHQDGALGRNGLMVLHTLIFQFLNFESGALFPSWAAIAERSGGMSVRSVGRGLAALRAAGVLDWINRKYQQKGGTWCQDSNAYHLHKPESWKGYAVDSIAKTAARAARRVLRIGAAAAASIAPSLPLPDGPPKPGPLSDALARLDARRGGGSVK